MAAKASPLAGKKLGFIGAGNMAEALMRGVLNKKLLGARNIITHDVSAKRLKDLAGSLGFVKAESNAEVLEAADIVVFAVKPQNVPEVLAGLQSSKKFRALLITICAGVPAATFEKSFGGAARVVRVMPNTPALIGAGAAALARGKNATGKDMKLALAIFQAVGVTVEVKEKDLDAVTGLSGSGPAYFFLLIEKLIEGGVQAGLSRAAAEKLVKQTALGAARLALESTKSVSQLRETVTSPGGTTAAGLAALRDGRFEETVIECVLRATARSKELGKGKS